MLNILLLACPQPIVQDLPQQGPLPSESQQQEKQLRAREWWNGLTKTQQQELLERHRRLKEMPAEAREELGRRAHALDRVRKKLINDWSPEEKAAFELLSPEEQHRQLRQTMHEMMSRHEADLRPHAPRHGVGMKTHERLKMARHFIEKHRADSLQIQFGQLVAEGWISPNLAATLEAEPLELKLEVLRVATKWRTWSFAVKSGWLQEWGLQEHQRMQLGMLPPEDFMRAISSLRSGENFDQAIRHNRKGNDAPTRHPDDSRRPPRMGPGRF